MKRNSKDPSKSRIAHWKAMAPHEIIDEVTKCKHFIPVASVAALLIMVLIYWLTNYDLFIDFLVVGFGLLTGVAAICINRNNLTLVPYLLTIATAFGYFLLIVDAFPICCFSPDKNDARLVATVIYACCGMVLPLLQTKQPKPEDPADGARSE